MIDYPKTLEEAKLVKYGVWRAGGKTGTVYDPKHCAYEVYPVDCWTTYQCLRKNGHGSNKLYCKQHSKIVNK